MHVCAAFAFPPLPMIVHRVLENKVPHRHKRKMVPLAYELLFILVELTGEEELGRRGHGRGACKDDEEDRLMSPWRPKAAVALTQCPYLPHFVFWEHPRLLQLVPQELLSTCPGPAEAGSRLTAPPYGTRRAKLQSREELGGRGGQRLPASCRGIGVKWGS